MAFDFDTPVARHHTGSLKWDRYPDSDTLPMWVADMDFMAPPALLQALHERIEHGVFGYTIGTSADRECVLAMLEREYGWRVTAESIVWIPGVVPGLLASARVVGGPGDGIICHTPIYHHFLEVAEQAGRRRIEVPLISIDGRFTYDLEATAQVMGPDVSSLHLCHPHNPVGTAFRPAELTKLLELCAGQRMVVVSDEIHCDLLLDQGLRHTPMAELAPKGLRSITLMSPSKTYNLAGLNCAFAVIPDRALRRAFSAALRNSAPLNSPLAFTAMRTVYEKCQDWRDELILYLRGNRDLLEQTIASLPCLSMGHLEATYLGWVNVSGLPVPSAIELFEKYGVGLSGGTQFGDSNYVRINFGCPRSQLQLGLERIGSAVADVVGLEQTATPPR